MDINKYSFEMSIANPFTNVYGLARSLMAMCTLITLLFNNWDELFDPFLVDHASVGSALKIYTLFNLFDVTKTLFPFVFSVLILLFVISGYFPKISGILHWWVAFSYYYTTPAVEGGDQIHHILALMLIPICVCDNRKNHWFRKKEFPELANYRKLIGNAFFQLIGIQVCIVYFQAGVDKLNVPEWRDGTALYYWFTHNIYGVTESIRPLMAKLLYNKFLVTSATWSVIVFEILLFGAIFYPRKSRGKFFPYAVLSHFLIMLMHGLMSFFFAMSGALILYLLDPQKELVLHKLRSFKSVFQTAFTRN